MSEPMQLCKKCGGMNETTRWDEHSQEVVTESCHHYLPTLPRTTGKMVAFDQANTDKVLALIRARFGDSAILKGTIEEQEKAT